MIVLTVIKFNGAPVSISPVSFDEIGGSIGRADTNQLVLPDVERTVSRVHAQVVFRSGQYALVDRGSNPVLHNGQAIGNGREALLISGDEIQIGGYLIKISASTAVKNDDPFAEFDGESSGALPLKSIVPKASPPMNKPVEPPRSASLPAAAGQNLTSGIPDDWDPFRPDATGMATNPGSAKAINQPGGRLNEAGNSLFGDEKVANVAMPGDSLDELFGLKSGSVKGDPLAGSSLQASQSLPNTAGGMDPVLALRQVAAPQGITAHDHDSDMQMPWKDLPVKQKVKPAAQPPADLPGVVLSWDAAEKRPASGSRPSSEGVAVAKTYSVPGGSTGPVQQGVDNEGLLQAFLSGLGAPSLRMQPLNADTMFQLGQLLRESTQGTVDLLAARTSLKKEVRAAVTVMVSTSNNALKFSPTVEFALQYLLGPPTAGFMGPLESMRDAFDDLKAHQLGVMAGMRAALSDVLKRFDPAVLEEKLISRGNAFSLMPSGKKARLWEMFQELFSQLAHEAEEDFDELFGKAFVREYERYVTELNAGKKS